MRPGALLREALLNMIRGTTRGGVFALLLGVILAALAGAEITAVHAIEERAAAYQRSGGSTLIYVADGRIDGATCDGLAAVDGVRASGAVAASPKLTALALPDSRIPAFSVTPGFGGFTALGGAQPTGGVLVSGDVAEQFAVRGGDDLPLANGVVRVSDVFRYEDDGRQPGLGYAVLVPDAGRRVFDQCWIEVWPQSEVIEHLLPSTVAGAGGGENQPSPELRRLNPTLGAAFDGAVLFGQRVTQAAPLVAAVAATVLGYVSVRRRRLELASALHSGVRRSDQFVQLLAETGVWATGAAVLAGTAATLLLVWIATPDAGALAWLAFRVVAAGASATIGGAALALAQTRERLLFAYFKQR